MTRYYILLKNTTRNYAYIDEYPVGQPRIDWSEWKNGLIQGDKAKGVTTVTSERYPAVLTAAISNRYSLPIFSKNLIDELNDIGVNNLEMHPITIKNHETGELNKDYFICNIIGLISCLDRMNSVWTADEDDPDEIVDIETLALSDKMIKEHNERLKGSPPLKIFRLEEYPRIVIIDKDVKHVWDRLNIQGWKCIEPQEWA